MYYDCPPWSWGSGSINRRPALGSEDRRVRSRRSGRLEERGRWEAVVTSSTAWLSEARFQWVVVVVVTASWADEGPTCTVAITE